MSLHMSAGMARLTVLGHGWNNDASIVSGDGYTFDGDVWKNIYSGLNYESADGIDWDTISDNEKKLDHTAIIYTGIDDNSWTDPFTGDIYPGGGTAVYTDLDGFQYFDYDGDGVWVNPDTGDIYDGNGTLDYTLPDDMSDVSGLYTNDLNDETWKDPTTGKDFNGLGDMWVPESMLTDMSKGLEDLEEEDSKVSPYSIPQNILDGLPIGGPVSEGGEPNGSDLPHLYSPAAKYYILSSNSIIFSAGGLSHKPSNGSEYTVVEANFALHNSEMKTAYFDNCHPLFEQVGGGDITGSLPSEYSGLSSSRGDVRHQYLVWQLCYGSFEGKLVKKGPDTITSEDIKNGKTGKDTMTIAGERYYRMKAEQVKDKI